MARSSRTRARHRARAACRSSRTGLPPPPEGPLRRPRHASTDVVNVAEQRALERAGFVREGVPRQAQARADGQHDQVLCSCLPGEPWVLPS